MPRDNRISDRTPQQIAASRQATLHGKVLKAFIKTNAFDETLDMFRKIISCPDARQSTKNEAAKALMQATIKMLPQSPHIQVEPPHFSQIMAWSRSSLTCWWSIGVLLRFDPSDTEPPPEPSCSGLDGLSESPASLIRQDGEVSPELKVGRTLIGVRWRKTR